MDNKGIEFLNALGAMAETAGAFRDNLITCGFTRDEAVTLAGVLIKATVESATTKGEKK